MWWHNTYVEAAVPSVPHLPLLLSSFLSLDFDQTLTPNPILTHCLHTDLNRTVTVYSNFKPHIYNPLQCLQHNLLLSFHLWPPRTMTSLNPMRLLQVCLDPQTMMKSWNPQALMM